MSLKSTFLCIFIAQSMVIVAFSQNSNQAVCVEVKKDNTFPVKFLPRSLERNQFAWEYAIRTIANYTNNCLQNFSQQRNNSCEKPVITITFPFISERPRIPLEVLPSPYLATKDVSSSTDSQIISALGQIWKLFVFCLMTAAISGIIIWFLDHRINSGHFPKSFWSGSREGLWWAVVTMTTVGYGDKTPKSFLGRAYAALWMIIGMLLMSSFTAQISSTITTDDLRPLDEKFGNNIGVPNGTRNFFEWYCPGAILIEKSSENSLFRSLSNGEVNKIYLFDCKENQKEKPKLKIVYVLPVKTAIGAEVILSGKMHKRKAKKKFDECIKQWADNYGDDDVYLGRAADKILKREEWKIKIPEAVERQRCIENHTRGRYNDDQQTTPQLGLIEILLYGAAGLLVTLLTVGAVWEACVKLRHQRKSLDNSADIEKAAGAQELQSTATIRN